MRKRWYLLLLALPLLAASCSKDNSVVSTSNDYCYIKSVMLGTVKRQVGTISTSFVGSYYEMTVNLRGPVIVNSATCKGCQIIIESDEYKVKYPIYDKLAAAKKAKEG